MTARPLHGADAFPRELTEQIAEWMNARIAHAPLGRTLAPGDMYPLLDGTFTADGLGPSLAWQTFEERVAPNNVALDSERFLAFIPVSPSAAGIWMEAAVGAATFSAESWLEASGAVAAENQTLRWLADLMDLPSGAGGCFMSGGSIGNLSALAVAREQCPPDRRAVAVSDTAHASVFNSLRLLGLHDTLVVPTGPDGRFTGDRLAAALGERSDVGIVIGAGGSTNAGVIDDLIGLADVAERLGAWLHVDAAYGGAALLLPERRDAFRGIERANSVIIDPHKWLFAPEGSCALLYREPALAAAVHTQHGPYVDVLHGDEGQWNPSDYGYQLTRRATGLPLWFALAVHGIEAHIAAVRVGVELAEHAAFVLDALPDVEVVMPPMLGVVLFRRQGWDRAEWRRWAEQLLADGVAFVAPSTWKGEPVGRLVFMHPRTPPSLIDQIAGSLVPS
jgi:glutamate/tyrosine decarboxylase-like PLP-dependent enzyme